MNNISRRDFLKGAAASAAGLAAFGALGVPAIAEDASAAAESAAAAALYLPGTYTSVQKTPYASIQVACTFSKTALTDVKYDVLETSDSDYFKPFANAMDAYCQRIVAAGTPDGVDAVSGATLCTTAISDGVKACTVQALGINLAAPAKSVLNPQEEGFDSFDGNCAEVFSAISLGTMTLPNRVIKSAGSSPWSDKNGSKIPVNAELYGEMAANGVSLVILAGGSLSNTGILPDSLEVKGDVVSVSPLIEAVHAQGGKIGFQMCYGGLAPTVPDAKINESTIEELDAFIDRVGTSAARAKEAGFDCIEIKGASADGLNGFLTRRINTREDDYGPQTIENRCRLFTRMIEKIKEVNGAGFPVGALINGVEENDVLLGDNDKFTTIEEAKEIAKTLAAAGADWLQLRVGNNGQEMNIWAPDVQHIVSGADGLTGYGTMFDYSAHYEGMVDGSKSGFASFLPMVKAIKEVVSVPVGCAAYMDLRVGPDYLNDAIARGELDLVFMNRPLNCDPALVRKMQEGDRASVRPCMKCMHCHDNQGTNRRRGSSCRMNAASFNSLTDVMPEGAKPTPAAASRKVLVIGAGPAGLEAAMVAAERGHKVTLCEATGSLGGLCRFARGVKGNHERFDDYFAYAAYQLQKNGVDVRLNTTVDAATVKDLAPDAVVVAVGGQRESKLTGTGAVSVLSPEQAFGASDLGDTVAILGANVQAVDFAAYLVAQGKKVVMVHGGAYEKVDEEQSGWFRTYVLPYLTANGTKIWNGASVLGVEDGGLRITTDAGLEKLIACDSVVEFYDMVPNTALADELKGAGFEVHAVGDCDQPYNIQRAVLAGNLAARAL